MVMTGIDRIPTDVERNEMQIVGDKTPLNIFLSKLAEEGQKFVKNNLPFDSQCARIDYEDEVERVSKENERTYGYVRTEDVERIKIDLDKYGKTDRFEIANDDEETEFVNINGIRTAVKVGHTIKYRCKARGHGISVFIPTIVYEERFIKKKVEKGG